MKKNQKGFSFIETMLVLIFVVLIGFVGWYVWQNQDKDEVNNKAGISTKKAGDAEDSISKNWKRYKSGQGAFSIKLADGLNGLRDTTSDLFIFGDFTPNDRPAVVKDTDGFGADGFFPLTIDQAKESDIWTPDEQLHLEKKDFITRSGVKGTKIIFSEPYEPPCEGVGCYLGDKHVFYGFTDSKTGMTTFVSYSRRVTNEETKRIYDITKSDPDYTELVDEMVKTLEIQG